MRRITAAEHLSRVAKEKQTLAKQWAVASKVHEAYNPDTTTGLRTAREATSAADTNPYTLQCEDTLSEVQKEREETVSRSYSGVFCAQMTVDSVDKSTWSI